MNKITIAIIIAAYNAEGDIERCLESVRMQDYKCWKAYIVNDGSTDNTESICKKYVEQDNRFILLSKNNSGCTAARRYGIDAVKDEDFITFLDSDDTYISAHFFSKVVDIIAGRNIDCVCFNYQIGEGKLFSKCTNEHSFSGEEEIVKNIYSRQIIDGNSQYAIYPAVVVKEHFKVLDCANDDYTNKLEMLVHCRNVLFIPDAPYRYTINQSSLTHSMPKETDIDYYNHAKIHTDIYKSSYPDITREADYFRDWILLWTASSISKNRKSMDLSYYKYVMKELKKASINILFSQYFSKKDKITFLLIRLRLFGFFYHIYHRKELYSKNR